MTSPDHYEALDSLPPQLKACLQRLSGLLLAPDSPTAIRDPGQVAAIHIADSLSGLKVTAIREADRVADLGSGPGLPGLVLAAALPRVEFDLIESVERKCRFIEKLRLELELTNVTVVNRRAEEWALDGGSERYDAVTARALASMPVLLEYAAPLLRIAGQLVAWKGTVGDEELLQAARAAEELGMQSEGMLPAQPYRDSRNRGLWLYSKVAATPARFPRRSGRAAKHPLGV